jgi:hypothetical protein
MRRQFLGGLLHRSAHGLEDVWCELQAERPNVHVDDLALRAQRDPAAFVMAEAQELTGWVGIHRTSSMRSGPTMLTEAGTSKAERSVLVAVTVTTSSSMTGWSAGDSCPPAAEIDHIKTGKATRLNT